MKHKKRHQETSAGLRQRIRALGAPSEMLKLETILQLDNMGGVPKKDDDILIEEHQLEGKPYLLCKSLSVEAGDKYMRDFRMGLTTGKGNQMTIRRKPLLKGRLLEKMSIVTGRFIWVPYHS
jgi:hypothetical protein